MKLGRSTLQSIVFCGKGSSGVGQFSAMQRTFCLSTQYDRSVQNSTALELYGKNRVGQLGVTATKNIVLIPKRFSSGGDHVKLWTAEKVVSAAFLPILPLAFLFPSAGLDYLLAFAMTIHSHWGIEAIVVDYVRPSVFGEAIPKVAIGLVWALSALTLGGLSYFIYSDVGLVNAIKMLWKL